MEKTKIFSKLLVIGSAVVVLCSCSPEKKEAPKTDVGALNKQETVVANDANQIAELSKEAVQTAEPATPPIDSKAEQVAAAPASEVKDAVATPAPESTVVNCQKDECAVEDLGDDAFADEDEGDDSEGNEPTYMDNDKNSPADATPDTGTDDGEETPTQQQQ